jgi:hypothetical protein
MLKDFMFNLYTTNIQCTDGAVLAETLRALSMAGMALSRILEIHCRIRVTDSHRYDAAEAQLRATMKSLNAAVDDLNL